MANLLKLTTLGNLVIRKQDETPLDGFSQRGTALLVYLARGKKPQSRLHLAELLWPERNQEQALANLRTLLTRLRAELEPYLLITRDTIGLKDYWLDANEVEGVLQEQTAPSRLEEILTLYSGKFLEQVELTASSGFEEWSQQERESLHRLVEAALRRLVSYYNNLQNFAKAISVLNRLLQFDALNEEIHRQLLLVLAFNGQRQLALQHYTQYSHYLIKELDIAPEAATTDLYEIIKTGNFDNLEIEQLTNQPGSALPLKITQLQRLSLFNETPLELIIQLADLLREVSMPVGTVIFEKDTPGDCMYIIVEGEILIHSNNHRLNTLKARDIFGEMALLDSAPRLATATALTDVRLWRLDQATLYQLMEKRVEIARAIIKVLLGWLRERVNEVVWLKSQLNTDAKAPTTPLDN